MTFKELHSQLRAATLPRLIAALLMILFAAGTQTVLADDVIRVTGRVISKEKRKPLMGVNVQDEKSGRLLATTDEDGRFATNVFGNSTLRFSMVGAKARTIRVKNLTYIEVEMDEHDIELGEATVVVKRIVNKIMPEPTQIEIRGNYAIIKTRVRVPREMFSSDTRLVVQPIFHNASKKTMQAMRPMVYDAQTYNRTQQRMYDFDLKQGDPLAKYITIKADSLREKGRKNDIIGYSDSIYIDDARDDYSCDVFSAIENYNRIIYRDTTIIARGTVNPLRFLDYAFQGTIVTDSAYYPKAEMQLRDSKGEIKLQFPIGSAKLDLSNPRNADELSQLNEQLQAIAHSKDASLRAFSIMGTASPDGTYAGNLKLAEKRMQSALNYIVGQLDSETRRRMSVSSKAKVAKWDDVVALLRRDSLNKEADAIQDILNRYKTPDVQGRHIRRLPFFRNTLEAKYLPQLRRVEYALNYSIFRVLTLSEIQQLYEKDYKQLSRYEFFRLYRAEADEAKREKIIRQALEIYPSFGIAASDLQAILIKNGKADRDLLKPYAGKKAPATLNANHMIALLNSGQYSQADSISDFLPDTPDTHMLKIVTATLNGDYNQDNFNAIAATGLRNEVVMLLAMKRNEEALKRSKELPEEEALTHYLRAVCLNRAEKPVEAYTELKQAFSMDPELERTAYTDGDVNDLILDKK